MKSCWLAFLALGTHFLSLPETHPVVSSLFPFSPSCLPDSGPLTPALCPKSAHFLPEPHTPHLYYIPHQPVMQAMGVKGLMGSCQLCIAINMTMLYEPLVKEMV